MITEVDVTFGADIAYKSRLNIQPIEINGIETTIDSGGSRDYHVEVDMGFLKPIHAYIEVYFRHNSKVASLLSELGDVDLDTEDEGIAVCRILGEDYMEKYLRYRNGI